MNIFLSASVPLPDRDRRFFETADVVAIRDAIKALAVEGARKGNIIFGGHPAITPLISLIIRQVLPNRARSFVLYQSAYFIEEFPVENDDFIDLRIVPSVEGDREASLRHMRERMLRDEALDVAFFIGGMEGIIEEHRLFTEYYPDRNAYTVASTGGASLELYRELRHCYGEQWIEELTYNTLFRDALEQF